MVVARHLPAVRAKRQQVPPSPPPIVPGNLPPGGTTITQIVTFFPSSVSSAIRPSTTTSSTTSSSTTLSVTTPSSTSSSTSLSTSPSITPPSTVPAASPSNPGNTSSGEDNAADKGNNNPPSRNSSSNGLSGGAIAGIVLGIILLLLLHAFFLLRRRQFRRRQNNKNAAWLATGGIEGGTTGMTGGYAFTNGMNEEKLTTQASDLPPLQPVRGTYSYPTSNYNNYNDVEISPRTVLPPAPSAPVAMPSSSTVVPAVMASMNNTSSVVTVWCTFVPSLPDELHIVPGDSLRVLQEFDDGWSLCLKTSTGEEGMVPSECFDSSSSSLLSTPGAGVYSKFGRGLGPERRASSLVGSGIHGRIDMR